MSKIENNKVVRVHYTGKLPDTGEVFDSSEGREPLTFLVGHRQMIPGFERELMGKELGEKVEFTLSPEDAYGEHNPDAIQQVPLEMFGGIKPEIGMTLMSDMGPFRVTEVGDELITVDFNHALAVNHSLSMWKLLSFETLRKKKSHTATLMGLAEFNIEGI